MIWKTPKLWGRFAQINFWWHVQLQLSFCSTHLNPWKQGILRNYLVRKLIFVLEENRRNYKLSVSNLIWTFVLCCFLVLSWIIMFCHYYVWVLLVVSYEDRFQVSFFSILIQQRKAYIVRMNNKIYWYAELIFVSSWEDWVRWWMLVNKYWEGDSVEAWLDSLEGKTIVGFVIK